MGTQGLRLANGPRLDGPALGGGGDGRREPVRPDSEPVSRVPFPGARIGFWPLDPTRNLTAGPDHLIAGLHALLRSAQVHVDRWSDTIASKHATPAASSSC